MRDPLRYKLEIARLPVKGIRRTLTGIEIALELPGLGTMLVPAPASSDVRETDRLTLYTEILIKSPVRKNNA